MKLASISAAVLGGAWLGQAWGAHAIPGWPPPPATFLLWSAATILFAVLWRRRGRSLFAPLAIAVALASVWRGGMVASIPSVAPPYLHDGARVVATGWLIESPRPYGDAIRLRLRVSEIDVNGQAHAADLPLDVAADRLTGAGGERGGRDFRYGDRYTAAGNLALPADASQLPLLRSSNVVFRGSGAGNPARRVLDGWRAALARAIRRNMSEPAAGVAVALTTGDRTSLDPGVRDAFRASGTAHLLAISGLHVGIVAVTALGAAAALVGRKRQLYLLVPAIAVWAYALLSGMADPVVRAAIMASVYLIGRAAGRQNSILPALGFAAAAMVLIEPPVLNRLSFQLSFAAVAGIAVLAPGFSTAGARLIAALPAWTRAAQPALTRLASLAAISLAATAATAPLVALSFGKLPVWSVPATLMALPAMPVLIVSSAATGVAGLVSDLPAQVLAWPAWVSARYMIETNTLFAALPPGPIDTSDWAPPVAILYYGAIAAALSGRRFFGAARQAFAAAISAVENTLARRPPGRVVPLPVLVGLFALAVAVWAGAAALPDGRLRVVFFETERGDLILIETPNGKQALIDGGGTALGGVRALSGRMPFWDRTIDLAVLTHPHADHLIGLFEISDRFRIDTLVQPSVEYDSRIYAEWLEKAPTAARQTITAVPGMWIALDRDVLLEVLSAGGYPGMDDVNDASVVIMLRYGDVSVLLTGDLTSRGESRLIAQGANLSATVLKTAHGGSRGSSSRAFLRAVSPALVVVPAGSSNPFGHPHEETLARLAAVVPNAPVFSTLEHGTVVVSTDGARVWVRPER